MRPLTMSPISTTLIMGFPNTNWSASSQLTEPAPLPNRLLSFMYVHTLLMAPCSVSVRTPKKLASLESSLNLCGCVFKCSSNLMFASTVDRACVSNPSTSSAPSLRSIAISHSALSSTPSPLSTTMATLLKKLLSFGASGSGTGLPLSSRFGTRAPSRRTVQDGGSLPCIGDANDTVPGWLRKRLYTEMSSCLFSISTLLFISLKSAALFAMRVSSLCSSSLS
mmetsp:Transcript_949/g.1930  ORF Transcript_949/g.1930 Transcript_949/m.1930 type:complete len:223 (+) Transcript_949:627-1295(+)